MATSRTRAQLVTRAAEKLGVIGSGQSLDDEDEDKIDPVVDSLFADLAARFIYDVAQDSEIELSAFEWLADLLADLVASDFGQQSNLAKVAIAEARLRAITASRPTYEPLRTTYY